MAIYYRTKEPDEDISVILNFEGQLPSGANIASATVFSTKESDGLEDSSVTTSPATVTNTTVVVHTQAGTHGETYHLKVTVTLDDSAPVTVLVEHIFLSVVDTGTVN